MARHDTYRARVDDYRLRTIKYQMLDAYIVSMDSTIGRWPLIALYYLCIPIDLLTLPMLTLYDPAMSSAEDPRIQLERPARSQHMSGAHENSSGSHAGYVYGDSVTSTSATPNQH